MPYPTLNSHDQSQFLFSQVSGTRESVGTSRHRFAAMPTGRVIRWLLPLTLLSAVAATDLLPNVTGDVTLTTAGSPWVVNETVYVEETGSLTVQPGVTVLMASGASLMVNGLFVAEGTPTQHITFTLLNTVTNATTGKSTILG